MKSPSDAGSPGQGRPVSAVRPARRIEHVPDDLRRMPRVDEHVALEHELGRGGMGVVHRGIDKDLGRPVAVKVLGEEHRENPAFFRRFLVEAQLGAQLEHPNIVPLYALVATPEGDPAFVMRLVEGETMAAYLEACSASPEASRTPPHDLSSRLERFLKACDAIQYAHSRGVIHRDLKPENVMLGVHNEVYVMDWGVARIVDGARGEEDRETPTEALEPFTGSPRSGETSKTPSLPALTQSGDVFGTPGYMSPEQARSEDVSYATDQYALGVMLAEVAMLKSAREGSTVMRISETMLDMPIELSHRFGEPVPRELEAIVRKATHADPRARYESVAEFAADVRRFLRDEGVSVLPDPAWFRLWRKWKRRPAVVLGALFGLACVVSIAVVLGLVRELGARSRAASQSERVAGLTASVGAVGRNLDARFQRIELLLEGLASSASEAMKRPPSRRAAPIDPPSLLPPSSKAVWIDRYKQRVTFDGAVHVRSPGVTEPEAEPVLARFGDLEGFLVRTSARAAADDEILGRSEATQRAAAREHSPILWTDLAFARGELLVYPGNTFFPADYDVRRRTWYVAAAERRGHVWGAPYPDATSGQLIVPCARAFHDERGALEGVAAAHVRLDDVLDAMAAPVAGFQWAALVDDAGNVVLSTRERGVRLDAGINENRDHHGDRDVPFPIASVRDAIAAHVREGLRTEASSLVVFQHLDTNPWTLAVVVDEAPYAFR